MQIAGVEVVHWNPRKYRVPGTGFRVGPRKMNFGDLLGPMIVTELQQRKSRDGSAADGRSVSDHRTLPRRNSGSRLVAVGSIMHFAHDGDTVWGTGVNGKISLAQHTFKALDIRSVRGPLTAQWLTRNKGLEVPDTYGDPGLLVGHLFPELRNAPKTRSLTVIPNLNEKEKYKGHPGFVSPTAPLRYVLRAIAESELVVGSSLHAMVVSDALGVPSALVKSDAEPTFKYEDYFLGTGRTGLKSFTDLGAATKAGSSLVGLDAYTPLENWNRDDLLRSFPTDLWTR